MTSASEESVDVFIAAAGQIYEAMRQVTAAYNNDSLAQGGDHVLLSAPAWSALTMSAKSTWSIAISDQMHEIATIQERLAEQAAAQVTGSEE